MSMNITLLKDLCDDYKRDIVDGPFGANLKREHYREKGIPVLKIQNIKSFNITLKKMDYVEQTKFDELRRHNYVDGDIVMTKLGNPLGESAIVEGLGEGLIVADLVRIRAKKINTQYLCYHLNSPVTSAYINSQQKGTTRPRVRIAVVRDLPIYTPSLAEQQRIVAILDQAFSDIEKARANAEQNLKNARELFHSYLNQVFSQRGEGWSSIEASKLVSISHGYSFKSPEFQTDFDGTKPIVLTPGNFTSEGTLYFNAKNTKRLKVSSYENLLFNEGDLVIVMTDLSPKMIILGKPAIIDREGVLHNQRIGRFNFLSGKVDKYYLYYFFLSDLSLRHIRATSTGTMVRHTAPKRILSNDVPYPVDLSKQQEIAGHLSWLKKQSNLLEAIYEAKLESLDELKKSLLQKAFSGELTKSKGIAA